MDQPEEGRREDIRLLTGQGRYTGDLFPDDALHAVFLRAPVARGRFNAPDVTDAAAMPGVVAVYTAADLKADGLTTLPLDVDPVRDDGGAPQPAPRPLLNDGVIRHLAEPVAMVVAASREAAEDAAEAIMLDFADAGAPVRVPTHMPTAARRVAARPARRLGQHVAGLTLDRCAVTMIDDVVLLDVRGEAAIAQAQLIEAQQGQGGLVDLGPVLHSTPREDHRHLFAHACLLEGRRLATPGPEITRPSL
jgi:carbon-monoxide dehydrogenase large subunit